MGAARWEYRLWQDAPPPLSAGEIEERTDLYLVRPGMTGRMVKLRDGCFDVKNLIAQADGLQCWQPDPKLPFPLDSGAVAAALCLDAGERHLLGPRHDCAESLVERLERATRTRVVAVRKRRATQDQRGCTAETAQVRLEGLWYGCHALEHADPDRLLAAIDALGWPRCRNESYIERLGREPEQGQPATTSSSQCRP